jgi:hypothetical protein
LRVGSSDLQLTYCTNIHPGSGWREVFDNLRRHAPELKRRVSPASPFGLGLRLSAGEARELLDPAVMEEFAGFLGGEGLYVALLNGFVYGGFHRQPVKEQAFAPDWSRPERVAYTMDLLRVLERLLPDGLDGGISTLPLSYKPWVDGRPPWEEITRNLIVAVEALVLLRRERDRLVHLDLEPEPDGLLETTDEVVQFFTEWLLPLGGEVLATRLGVTPHRAQEWLLQHVRVCFDSCHLAVEYEEPVAAWRRLAEAGIQVGRVQVSSALEVELPARSGTATPLMRELGCFADSIYLHQVVEGRTGKPGRHFADLPEALRCAGVNPEGAGTHWRVHFHVPLFVDRYGPFGSTQASTASLLELAGRQDACRHLEIETYTWDVLPAGLKRDLVDSICREYEWVLARVG